MTEAQLFRVLRGLPFFRQHRLRMVRGCDGALACRLHHHTRIMHIHCLRTTHPSARIQAFHSWRDSASRRRLRRAAAALERSLPLSGHLAVRRCLEQSHRLVQELMVGSRVAGHQRGRPSLEAEGVWVRREVKGRGGLCGCQGGSLQSAVLLLLPLR
jgi:hypothetical protein